MIGVTFGFASLDAQESSTLNRTRVEGYRTRMVEGWTVHVSVQLSEKQPVKTRKSLELLAKQLETILEIIPENALKHIQVVPIWLSPEYPGVRPTAEYHPSRAWLQKEGRPIEMAECVELTNIAIFEKECRRMPMMILHELAHAYHHQVLGFENAEIQSAYQRALASGSYDRVKRNTGRTERAYGMNNHKEYFAESTEAYFGTNDFFPFNRGQLHAHDPKMERLLGRLWKADEGKGPQIRR